MAKNSTGFSLNVTVCFAKVKRSSFNPAFVVPEEHLESLKEHFHRCWVHMLWVHSQCLQPCKREPQQHGQAQRHHAVTNYNIPLASKKIAFVHHSRGCFCVEHKDIGMLTKTGSDLPVTHLWLMEDLCIQHPVSSSSSSSQQVFIIP